MTGSTGVVRAAFGVALAALAGCSEWSSDPTAPPPPPPPSAAFDGRYSGTIRSSGSSTGIDSSECAVEPRVTFDVRNGSFSYTMNHAKLVQAAPTARDIATSVYRATIAADGSIDGISDDGAAMNGRIEGRRMSGNIYGLLCYYSFTADRP